ncbi:MAG TPA: transporter substrate-binding domain-containing protein [Burkholderiales bacterium]|nr:transporter substrate-binding domain-containing protein [Burkholderiales bacterium]
MAVTPNAAVVAELAPNGVLRAGINLSNFLLVTGRAANGDPQGIAPDMAAEIAARLKVPLKLIPYESPGKLADAVADWDVGLIGAEPARAAQIAFTAAYLEIESTYLVPAGSTIRSVDEVDRKGVRIAVADRSAYGLYLDRSIKNAELVHAAGLDASYEIFLNQKLDALAGLRPRLLKDVQKLPGARVLEGRFTAVQQAVGTPKARVASATFLAAFVEEAKVSGLVARLIERHGVQGVTVAPAS